MVPRIADSANQYKLINGYIFCPVIDTKNVSITGQYVALVVGNQQENVLIPRDLCTLCTVRLSTTTGTTVIVCILNLNSIHSLSDSTRGRSIYHTDCMLRLLHLVQFTDMLTGLKVGGYTDTTVRACAGLWNKCASGWSAPFIITFALGPTDT